MLLEASTMPGLWLPDNNSISSSLNFDTMQADEEVSTPLLAKFWIVEGCPSYCILVATPFLVYKPEYCHLQVT